MLLGAALIVYCCVLCCILCTLYILEAKRYIVIYLWCYHHTSSIRAQAFNFSASNKVLLNEALGVGSNPTSISFNFLANYISFFLD